MNVNFQEIFAGPVFKYSAYNEGPAQRIKNATIIVREFMRAGFPLGGRTRSPRQRPTRKRAIKPSYGR